jgi:hypothetical protein
VLQLKKGGVKGELKVQNAKCKVKNGKCLCSGAEVLKCCGFEKNDA